MDASAVAPVVVKPAVDSKAHQPDWGTPVNIIGNGAENTRKHPAKCRDQKTLPSSYLGRGFRDAANKEKRKTRK